MSTPPHSGLHCLVEHDKRNSPLLLLSNAPTVGDAVSKAQDDKPIAKQSNNDNDNDNYENDDDNYAGLDFKRVPYLERRQVEHSSRGGLKS